MKNTQNACLLYPLPMLLFLFQVVKKKKETVAVKKSEIDHFTQSAPNHCLFLLDVLGSPPVFRMCDLFVAIVKRNGEEYRDTLLRMILNEVNTIVQFGMK
jgi:hypothetical protein